MNSKYLKREVSFTIKRQQVYCIFVKDILSIGLTTLPELYASKLKA